MPLFAFVAWNDYEGEGKEQFTWQAKGSCKTVPHPPLEKQLHERLVQRWYLGFFFLLLGISSFLKLLALLFPLSCLIFNFMIMRQIMCHSDICWRIQPLVLVSSHNWETGKLTLLRNVREGPSAQRSDEAKRIMPKA